MVENENMRSRVFVAFAVSLFWGAVGCGSDDGAGDTAGSSGRSGMDGSAGAEPSDGTGGSAATDGEPDEGSAEAGASDGTGGSGAIDGGPDEGSAGADANKDGADGGSDCGSPTVSAVDPAVVYAAADFPITLYGTRMSGVTEVTVSPVGTVTPSTLTAVSAADDSRLDAIVPKGLQVGVYDVTVREGVGCVAVLPRGLVVTADLSSACVRWIRH